MPVTRTAPERPSARPAGPARLRSARPLRARHLVIAHRLTLRWEATSPAWGHAVKSSGQPEPVGQVGAARPVPGALAPHARVGRPSDATIAAVQEADRLDLASSFTASGMQWAGSGVAVLFGHSGEPVGRVFDPIPDGDFWTCIGWLLPQFADEAGSASRSLQG